MGKINKSKLAVKTAKKNEGEMEVDGFQLPKSKKLKPTLFKAKQIQKEQKQKLRQPTVKSKKLIKESLKESPVAKVEFKKKEPAPKLQKKEVKRKEKHDNLMKKFKDQKKKDKEERKRKIREKAAITGDLQPLKDALPSLDELLKIDRNDLKTGLRNVDLMSSKKKLTRVEKIKRHENEMMNRVSFIENMRKNKDFKKNPREVIAQHIKFMRDLDS